MAKSIPQMTPEQLTRYLRKFSEYSDGPTVQSLHEIADSVDELAEEVTRLRLLLDPVSINSKKLTDDYPSTIEEVLHLLSCYWADVTPFGLLFDDEYFGSWERIARPVIEHYGALPKATLTKLASDA